MNPIVAISAGFGIVGYVLALLATGDIGHLQTTVHHLQEQVQYLQHLRVHK